MNPIKLRLAQFIEFLNISVSEFERESKLGTGTATKANFGLSRKSINLISAAYPQLNPDWLKTGEGEMLRAKGEGINVTASEGSAASFHGAASVTNSQPAETIDRLLSIIERQQEQLTDRDRQITQLISLTGRLLENK